MQGGKSGGEAGASGGSRESTRASPKLLKAGDRQLITVELRPGETTYVSWKKLTKDAKKVNGSATQPDPVYNANPSLESRLAPLDERQGQSAEKEMKEQSQPNRFKAVIEKIERLYKGKDSSDDEELDSAPDDDEYDTEDSFIDDAELDEYFEVDNSAIKHDGFFVNRGKLERVSENPPVSNQQLKKRRRKDLEKVKSANHDIRVLKKQAKIPRMTGENTTSLVRNLDPAQIVDVKDSDKQTAEAPRQNDITTNRMKDASGHELSHQKYRDRSACNQSRSQLGKSLSNNVGSEAVLQQKDNKGVPELPDLNISAAKYPVQTCRSFHSSKKEAASARHKVSVLEKSIRELEKAVAESRPATAVENQDADAGSQAVKRRLPREVKTKLAKVARIAASQGKASTDFVSKEFMTRLMSIVGHLIQLRSLKRNLKIMISMGLSANEEKANKFQQIKKEVVEMINSRLPLFESQASELQIKASDDFQEPTTGDRAPPKRKFVMDSMLEDKICDLYDIYVDGLDEDAGPQIRKLYVELAELWPGRLMDNHGIKRAICRAKERKRTIYGKEVGQEISRRKKPSASASASKPEDTLALSTSTSQQQHAKDRLLTDSVAHSSTLSNKPAPSTTMPMAEIASPSLNEGSSERPKQEKLKAGSSSSNFSDENRAGDMPAGKKIKKKAAESDSLIRPEKSSVQTGEDVHKSTKQTSVLPQKQDGIQFDGPDLNQPS